MTTADEKMREDVSLLRKYAYEFALTYDLETHTMMLEVQKRIINNSAQSAERIKELKEQVAERNAWLAECYRQSGADPDGNEDWRLAPDAVKEVTRLRHEHDDIEQQVGLYQADNERIWSFMPELKDTPEHYEIHEAVQHVVQQKEQLQAQVAMLTDSLAKIKWHRKPGGSPTKYEYEIECMAHDALSVSTQTAEAYKRRVQAEALEAAAQFFIEEPNSASRRAAKELDRMAAELKEGE